MRIYRSLIIYADLLRPLQTGSSRTLKKSSADEIRVRGIDLQKKLCGLACQHIIGISVPSVHPSPRPNPSPPPSPQFSMLSKGKATQRSVLPRWRTKSTVIRPHHALFFTS